MSLEVWFDDYQYIVENVIGESAVKFLTVKDLGINLDDVALRYGHHTGDPALRACIAEQYPGLSADQVVVTSGPSEALYRRLAENYRTFAVPGRCFGMDNRYFRLGFGATSDEIRRGLKNLDSALADLRSG